MIDEHSLRNIRILVTGICGTIGKELVRQMIEDYDVQDLVGIDNNESDLFFVEQKYHQTGRAKFFLADVRDLDKLTKLMEGIDLVFHTAAFKHVVLCERSPFEAVQTNILGVRNIITAANQAKVQRVIFTSSDKAVNPTNVMGTSKLMGERLMTAANCMRRANGPVLASTRFGNVLGSRGSVIPIFKEQIRRGGPVTLTSSGMTRFIMSIEEAVRLVIDSAMFACGGEVFITKMPVIRIKDLAEVMVRELAPRFGFDPEAIEFIEIGAKAGEKMYEELMTDEETRRAWEIPRYFVVYPAFTGLYQDIDYAYPEVLSKDVGQAYNSRNEVPLTQEELAEFMRGNDLLLDDEEAWRHPDQRY